jgi:hypothetical protein
MQACGEGVFMSGKSRTDPDWQSFIRAILKLPVENRWEGSYNEAGTD